MASELRRNKWYKHQLLLKSPTLAKFLPESYPYSAHNLSKMLNIYHELILKPVVGSGGLGIMKVTKLHGDQYNVLSQKANETVTGIDALVHTVNRLKRRRSLIIQYCIPLARVGGKLIDFRYIVQRIKGNNKWVITGKHAKIGQEGYVVTNLQQGANVETVRGALVQANIKTIEKTMSDLDYLSLEASKSLTRVFKAQNIWGFDLGVDVNGRVWMIEANVTPLVRGFLRLKDHSMYRTIRKYQALNRRL